MLCSFVFNTFFFFFKRIFFLKPFTKKKKLQRLSYFDSLSLFFKLERVTAVNSVLLGIDMCIVFVLRFKNKLGPAGKQQTRFFFRESHRPAGFSTLAQDIDGKATTDTNLFFWYGLKTIWSGIRFWALSLLLGFIIFYVLMALKFVPLLKISFQWFCIIMFLYWIFSGFVFFVKKYQTSKFTTAIQRFWRRTYIVFWLIETSIFLTFLYVTFNASQEPFYMHDQIKVFKTHLFSWRYFLIKVVAVAVLVVIGYVLLLFLKWNIFNKQSILFFFVTLFLTYVVWLEFYQFFHIISYYGGLFWLFDDEDRLWTLENDFNRTRLVNNYVALCLMAKFWHLIFIYVFWIFFILRSHELQRYRFPMLSANLQNFVILYIFCWLFMYPWFKHYARKYMDYSYYWFFTNSRELGARVFFNDIKLFWYGATSSYNLNIWHLYKFDSLNFYYWLDASSGLGFSGYRKHFIKNAFLSTYYSSVL